jgi:hypothetical protein
MSEMGSGPGGGGQGGSTATQVQEKAQQVASQATEQAREKASQAKGRVAEQVDQRSTQIGEQATSLAQSLRKTGEQLRGDGNDSHARYADQAADRVERLGTYLRDSDGQKLVGDVERFGRERPWMIALAGAVAGLAGSRFLKASSERRYRESSGPVGRSDGFSGESWTAGPRTGYESTTPMISAGGGSPHGEPGAS